MMRLKRFTLVLFVIAACILGDQLTKEMAREQLPRTKVLSFAGGALKLDYNENKGAVFSFE